MNVPISHYIKFWIINSLMAIGTGFVIGLMALKASAFFVNTPLTFFMELLFVFLFPLGFFFSYQFILASFFWGKRRGEFEYSFLEKTAECGKLKPELSKRLIEVKEELKLSDQNSAYLKLKEASAVFPDNVVVHFKYAISCERLGLAEDAIASYETAVKLLPNSAVTLSTYIEKQISRVTLKGPTKMTSAPGLQHIMY